MSYKVLITDYYYPDLEQERQVFQGTDIEIFDANGKCTTEDDVIKFASDADAIITQFVPITRNIIQKLQKCKVIVRYAIGLDIIDIPAATEHRIMVANVPDYCTDEVANHALALMLNLLRKISLMDRDVREGNWSYKKSVPITRFSNQTIGLIAFGRIARSFARKASGLGFKILAYDPYFIDKQSYPQCEFVSLEELLQRSDIISVHTPSTDETRGLLNGATFSMMKDSAFIINTSRGDVIVEEDLVKALRQGKIAGAGLDVLIEEGDNIKKNPLVEMENVSITPHMAWYSADSIKELQRKTAEQVKQALLYGRPENQVNIFPKIDG